MHAIRLHEIWGPVADAMVLSKVLYGGSGKSLSRAAWAAAVTLVFGDKRRSIIQSLQKNHRCRHFMPVKQSPAFHAG
jgi:uncharacterized protein (DUF2062 family)